MAGPGDQSAAGAGRDGDLRASHADRDLVVEILKAAFVQGRLDKEELDLRVSQVLASRSYAQLNALTRDLPIDLASALPAEPAREPRNEAVALRERRVTAAWACATIVLPSAAVTVALMATGASIGLVLLAVVLFASMVAMPISGFLIKHGWPDDRPS